MTTSTTKPTNAKLKFFLQYVNQDRPDWDGLREASRVAPESSTATPQDWKKNYDHVRYHFRSLGLGHLLGNPPNKNASNVSRRKRTHRAAMAHDGSESEGFESANTTPVTVSPVKSVSQVLASRSPTVERKTSKSSELDFQHRTKVAVVEDNSYDLLAQSRENVGHSSVAPISSGLRLDMSNIHDDFSLADEYGQEAALLVSPTCFAPRSFGFHDDQAQKALTFADSCLADAPSDDDSDENQQVMMHLPASRPVQVQDTYGSGATRLSPLNGSVPAFAPLEKAKELGTLFEFEQSANSKHDFQSKSKPVAGSSSPRVVMKRISDMIERKESMDVDEIKRRMSDVLGARAALYWRLMRLYTEDRLSKSDCDEILSDLLGEELLPLHNLFVLSVLCNATSGLDSCEASRAVCAL